MPVPTTYLKSTKDNTYFMQSHATPNGSVTANRNVNTCQHAADKRQIQMTNERSNNSLSLQTDASEAHLYTKLLQGSNSEIKTDDDDQITRTVMHQEINFSAV